MSTLHPYWSSLRQHLLPAVMSSGIMATLLLAIVAVTAAILKRRRASAATLCQVWAAMVLCLLGLPLASQLVPAWTLSLGQSSHTAANQVAVSAGDRVGPTLGAIDSDANSSAKSTETASIGTPLIAASPAPVTKPSKVIRTTEFLAWLPVMWLTGFVVFFCSTILGWCSLFSLRLTTKETEDSTLLQELHDLKNELGIRRQVRLIVSGRRVIPMTWGIWRPTIHLPSAAVNWSDDARRAVLLHELAHISRHDCLAQLFSRLACAVYWYNPLMWYAMWSLRAEQEASCDDAVLNQGTNAASYAMHLTQIVVGRMRFHWETAVALAAGRASRLERRVTAILNATCNRRSPSMRQTALSSLLIVGSAIAVSSASPLRFAVAQENSAKTASDGADAEKASKQSLAGIRDTLLKNYVRPLDDKLLTRSAIEGMLATLNDPYSQYISAKDLAVLRISVRGALTGIGARLKTEDGHPMIEFPLPGSPALESGLKPGDVILEIDSVPAKSLQLRDVANRIRGPIGSVVTLKIRRGENVSEVKVTRDRIKLRTAHGLNRRVGPAEKAERFMIDSANKIGYVRLSSFSENTPNELNEILQKLIPQGMKGAILDLRFCPGGTLKSAVGVANLFLREGNVVIIRGRDGDETARRAANEPFVGDFPLVVVVNELTASAAEIVAGALQDHGRAKIVGTRTYGKASVQTLIPLSDELGAIKLTTAFYCPPHGRNIDRMPGKATWGIDADEGYFVAVPVDQRKQLQKQFGTSSALNQPRKRVDAITPETLRNVGDTQLAAALQAVQAKLKTGSFVNVGGSRVDLEDYVRRSEIQSQHAKLLEKLNQLNEIANELKSDNNGIKN